MSQKAFPMQPDLLRQAPQTRLTALPANGIEARVLELLEDKAPVVLVTIVHSEGSAPRHAGTRALQTHEGFHGTVGGGILEAKAMQCARDCLDLHRSCEASFHLEANNPASDMICGGSMRIFCEYLDQKHKDDFAKAVAALQNGQNGAWLVIGQRSQQEDAKLEFTRRLIFSTSDLPKRLPADMSAKIRACLINQVHGPTFFTSEDIYVYLEPLSLPPVLVLLGGGHVALEVASLAHACGFVVDVVDDRKEFANAERFPMARRCRVLPAFSGVCEELAIGPGHFVAIMTRGHAYDQTCLEQVLQSPACYIGMIGSKKKKAQVFEALQKKGVASERLKSVFCPIGLAIKAESPQQIAVSIVAELLAVKGKVEPWCSALSKS